MSIRIGSNNSKAMYYELVIFKICDIGGSIDHQFNYIAQRLNARLSLSLFVNPKN